MAALVVLGLVLGLDSLRVSAGLGTRKLSRVRRWQIACAFGLCDTIAPLVGLVAGQSIVSAIGEWTEPLGPLVLGGYGLYVVYLTWHGGELARDDERWAMFGLAIFLGLDNLVAGIGLGLLGFPVLLSAFVLGAISGLMSLAGLYLGFVLGKILPAQSELVGGVMLLLFASALAINLL